MKSPQRRYPLESWVLLHPPEAPPLLVTAVPSRTWSWPTWVAWGLIGLMVASTVVLQAWRAAPREGDQRQDRMAAILKQVEARYVLGIPEFLRAGGGEQILAPLKSFKTGPAADQLRYVIFAGELVGPKRALQELDEMEYRGKRFAVELDRRELRVQVDDQEKVMPLDKKRLDLHFDRKELLVRLAGKEQHYPVKKVKFTSVEWELIDLLRRLYTDYEQLRLDGPSVSLADRQLLRDQLGWTGELALAPEGVDLPEDAAAGVGAPGAVALARAGTPDPDERSAVLAPARWTFWSFASVVSTLFVAGTLGLAGLIVCLFLYLNGKLHGHLDLQRGNGGIYVETFALWMLLFLTFGYGVPWLLGEVLPSAWLAALPPLAISALTMFLSLLALGWPQLRGIPWRTMRREIGLTLGRHPAREALLGPAGYAMSLPILVIGLMLTLVLMGLQRALAGGGDPVESGGGPAHPIVYVIAQGDWWLRLQALFLASVAAPIVEETMFRGVLYRHLREVTGRRFGFVLSVLLSALFVSFIFAVIHPQGVLAVPALMALALGFSLLREWRGTLLPSMIAHGVNNGILTLLMFLVLG